jgi:hypothetical protein
VLKLHAIRFTTHKKTHYLAIDHADFSQIQNDASVVRLEFEKSPQLGYRQLFDPATQDKYPAFPSRRSLNPKSHRSVQLTDSRSRLSCTLCLPSEH